MTRSNDWSPPGPREPNGPLRLRVKLVREGAKAPAKTHAADAGWDFALPSRGRSYEVQPGSVIAIPLGVALAIPDGWFLLLKERSSHAKLGVFAVAGVVDSSYRGEVVLMLQGAANMASPLRLIPGDRVCQGLLLPVPAAEAEIAEDLGETERGAGGFGSTGR